MNATSDYQQTSVFGVTTPQDVRLKKEELAVAVMNTNDAVTASQDVSNSDKLAWFRWKATFESFRSETDSIASASSSYARALQFQDELAKFQKYFAGLGVSIGGIAVKPPVNEPSTAEKALTTATDFSKTLKTVAIVGGVLIGVMLIMNIYAGTKVTQQLFSPNNPTPPKE